MNNLLEETKYIMRKYGVIADKKLGQNFLINSDIIEGIIQGANLSKDDLVIEIGPGLGTMTKYLSQASGKVICVELDKKMINVLQDRFKDEENIDIIYGDILKIDLQKIINENCSYKNVKVVANLPYYITTPIIMRLLEERLNIKSITIMVQKEVADRIVANPNNKDYGVLTVSIAYYSKASLVLQVPSIDFLPEPKVNSSVVNLEINDEIQKKVLDEKTFFSIVKGGFSQRRKIFLNSIDSILIQYNIDKESFKEILKEYCIDEMVRAENINIENFIKISNKVYDLKKDR